MFTRITTPYILMDPTEAGGGGGGGEPVAPAAPAAPSGGSAPWSADLESRFTDPAIRGQVDAYLRESIQPRMTQLEQQLASRPDLPPEAAEMWNDWNTDPQGTMETIVHDLFGEQGLEGWRNLFTPAEQKQVEAQAAAEGTTPQQITLDMLPEDVREVVEERTAQKEQTEYHAELDALIKALAPNDQRTANQALTEADKDFIHPFVQIAAANGQTLGDAANMYIAFREALRNGATQAEAQQAATDAGETEQKPAAPVTLGADGAVSSGVTVPPTETKRGYDGMTDAIREFVRENRQAAPTTVGTV